MEQLDLVYNTFTTLDRGYSHSKKSRDEYIKDKFGGDINIGSFLILNALADETFTSQEDIEKYSEIQRIITAIQRNAHRLDSLTSFKFDDDNSENSTSTSAVDTLSAALTTGEQEGTGIRTESQVQLAKRHKGIAHYYVSPGVVDFVPLAKATYLKAFNPGMTTLLRMYNKTLTIEEGSLYQRMQSDNPFIVVKQVGRIK